MNPASNPVLDAYRQGHNAGFAAGCDFAKKHPTAAASKSPSHIHIRITAFLAAVAAVFSPFA